MKNKQTRLHHHSLALRPLTADDFPLLLHWLSQPHVKEWWDDGDDTLEKVAHHYGNQSARREHFILLYEDNREKDISRAIGYMQYEIDAGGLVSIDQFIGDNTLLSRGIGTQAIQLLIRLILNRHRPVAFMVDPSPHNRRAIRCYEKVGFKYVETIHNEDGTEAYMMRLASG